MDPQIAAHYFQGPIVAAHETADDGRHMASPEAVLRQAMHAMCGGCRQPIKPGVTMVHVRGEVFHRSCARKMAHFDPSSVTSAPSSTRVIGTLAGVALPFGQQCFISQPKPNDPHGCRSERFAPECFDRSIARGGQYVKIDHEGLAIPGTLTLYTDTKLSFRFRVFDTSAGRDALDDARAGRYRGVSIRFDEPREQYVNRHVIEVREAALIEISLCKDCRPAWYSTAVWEER